jgi:hypothetical protein
MERRIEILVDTCVSDLRSGRATMEQCLSRYPDLRREIEPLLRIAMRLAAPTKMDEERKATAREVFLSRLHDTSETREALW